jgi:hypothetical protein
LPSRSFETRSAFTGSSNAKFFNIGTGGCAGMRGESSRS